MSLSWEMHIDRTVEDSNITGSHEILACKVEYVHAKNDGKGNSTIDLKA